MHRLNLRFITVLFIGLCLAACAKEPPKSIPIDISNVVIDNGVDPESSALKIIRLSDGQIWQSGGARLSYRYPPASTSKILHTLIMIEDGVAAPDTKFEWDRKTRFVENWNRDQTLASAFKYSTVWVYQDMVTTQGHKVMAEWMERLNYGNAYIGPKNGVTTFDDPEASHHLLTTTTRYDLTTYWLRGPLGISADEQIEFLTQLVRRGLPFSEQTYATALPIMIETQTKAHTLYAKTGWRHDGEKMDIGWYVGWVETTYNGQPDTYVFAFNMDMPDGEGRKKRKTLVKSGLASVGAMPN